MDIEKNIPIFIHHEGNALYLKDCIIQAQKYNRRVVLFGDGDNISVADEGYDVSNFSSSLWDEFAKYYSNMSYYSDEYALNIIKRFFVFLDFMKKNEIKECINIDSDVLVFVNFSEISKLNNYKAAFVIPQNQGNMRVAACAGCAYWKREALEDFLNYCISMYRENHYLLKRKWEYHQENHMSGGVCEMNLLFWWYENRTMEVWNWSVYNKEGVVDSNFNLAENYVESEYQMDRWGIGKKIIRKNGEPYFVSSENGEVKAWAIHFGGGSKVYIPYFRKHLKIAFGIPYINKVKSYIKKCFIWK